MRPRIAIIAVLAMGSLLAASATAFGTSALSTDTTASLLQYGAGAPTQQVAGVMAESPGAPIKAAAGEVAPQAAAAQAPRQLAAVSGSDAARLPFTGMALLPIMLLGAALLAWGLVLRRRAADSGTSI